MSRLTMSLIIKWAAQDVGIGLKTFILVFSQLTQVWTGSNFYQLVSLEIYQLSHLVMLSHFSFYEKLSAVPCPHPLGQ